MSHIGFIVSLSPVFLMECKFPEYSVPMKTDASNVEDINIHHIKECLLLSCVASFALDHSTCARMIWILTTILIQLRCKNSSYCFQQWICPCAVRSQGSPSSIFHQFIRFPLLSTFHSEFSLMTKRPLQISPFLDAAQSTCSEEIDFRVWFSPGFLMQWKVARQQSFRCIARLNSSWASILLWHVLHLNLFESFCVLFDITSEQVVELKWLMLNKHKRWFHSSRVKFPLVSMSASWFSVSMFLIWILGSKLMLSNNQSRATLWVLQTCLIVGLLPFIIILITASLSSNTYNKTSWREELTFDEIKSTSSKSSIIPWDFSFLNCVRYCTNLPLVRTQVSPCFITLIRVSTKNYDDQIPKSSAGFPSNLNPASKEMISDSVELCETEVCFLHIQLIGTNVWLPETHNVPPEVDFESSRSPAKSESWNSPNLHCLAVFST